jgi:hypothetical protein
LENAQRYFAAEFKPATLMHDVAVWYEAKKKMAEFLKGGCSWNRTRLMELIVALVAFPRLEPTKLGE